MANREPTRQNEDVEPRSSSSTTLPATAFVPPSDTSGKLALVLGGFAVAGSAFLILLVAISASNA